ncbi:MAG: hypothetical protein CL946_05050 [Ectothiorhodospiraceae bacterium]|nr:hypothetical protein [Ectothiorhodospiraceae bacterium]
MKIRTHVAILIAVVILSASAVAQQNPQADAEYLNMRYEYTLSRDGSVTMTYSHALKLYTGFAFTRQYGETFIVYNPEWQSLEVTKSTTEMADGSMVESPANAFNEVLPRFAHNITPYLHLREMVVTHTGLEPDATINLEYTVTTKPGFIPGLMDRVLLAQRSPVRTAEVVVRVPEGTPLQYQLRNYGEADPTQSKANGYDVYTWMLSDIPLVAVEDHQPSMWEFCPVLAFSTASFDDIVKHAADPASADEITAVMEQGAKAAVEDAADDIAKLSALQKYLHTHVATMGGGLAHTGYLPQTAKQTFARASGSPLDKAVLFGALCKAVGVKAIPALISDSHVGEGDPIPCLAEFTQAGVLYEGKVFDASSVQHTLADVDIDGHAYLPLQRGTSPVIYQAGRHNVVTKSDWTITGTGLLTGRTAVEAAGAPGSELNPEAFGKTAVRRLSKAGWGVKASLEDAEMRDDVTECEVKLESKSPYSANGGLVQFALPELGYIDALHVQTTSAKRTTPTNLKIAVEEEHLMTLHLPEGMKPLRLPAEVELSNSVGSVTSKFIDHISDIEIIRRISVPARVSPENYGELKALIDVWNDPQHRGFVLEVQ